MLVVTIRYKFKTLALSNSCQIKIFGYFVTRLTCLGMDFGYPLTPFCNIKTQLKILTNHH